MKEVKGVVLKVGIAGLGRSGWGIHGKLLDQLKDKYRVVAVCDPVRARRQEAVEKFGCRAYSGIEELARHPEVELLIVATPSHQHVSNSILALRAGKHVVCEKPMAGSLREADRVIREARKARRILAAFQNRRYDPDFVKVREVIESGILGRAVLIKISGHGFSRRWDWQTLKEFGGGTLNNAGPHSIDQALVFFKKADPEVFCQLEKTITCGDAEDHVKIILRAPCSPMVDIELTSVCAYPQPQWLVMGTRGGLVGNNAALRWKHVEPGSLPPRRAWRRQNVPDRKYFRDQISWTEECWSLPEAGGAWSLRFYTDLYNTLRQGAPLAISPESVRRQIAVIEQCRKQCPI